MARDKEEAIEWSDELSSNNGDNSHTFWRCMKNMIRWKIFKQWTTKFTYFLMTVEIRRDIYKHWPCSRTSWWRMKRKGQDAQMRGLQTIDQVHIHPGDRWKERNGIVRWEVFKQLTKTTYELVTDEEVWMDDQKRGIQALTKLTYELGTDEEDGMGKSDERYSNKWPRLRTT